MVSMKLLVRPAPALEECFADYAARLAEVNGLKRSRDIFRVSKIRTGPASSALDGLDTGVESTLLEHMHLRYIEGTHRATWRGRDFASTGPMPIQVRVCAACLAEDRPRSILWRLRFSIGCLRHRTQLMDRCPACRVRLSSWRGSWHYCGCGYDLRQAQSIPLTNGAVALQCLIEGAHLPELSLARNLIKETAVQSLWAQEGCEGLLLWMARCSVRRVPGKRFSLLANDAAWLQAAELLVDWPHKALTYFQRRWSDNLQARVRGDEDERFRICAFDLLSFCSRPAASEPVAEFGRQLDSVRKAVEDCYAVSPLRKAKSTSETETHVSIPTAIRKLGADRALIERLVDDGFIPTQRVAGKQAVRLVPRTLLPELSTFLLGLLTGREVMNRLAVTAALLNALVKTKVLRMVEKRTQAARGHFPKHDVDRLLDKLEAVATVPNANDGRRARLGIYKPYLRRGHASSHIAAARLILRALKGEISIWREPDGQGLARFSVTAPVVDEFKLQHFHRGISMQTLLVRAAQEAGESWMGYQLRLAYENGLSRIGWLPRKVGGPQLQPEQTIRLARHCPQCLHEGKSWQEAWTWSGVPVCTQHGIALRDHCPGCGVPLTWRQAGFKHCACGQSLAAEVGDGLSDAGRHLALGLGGDFASSAVAQHLGALPMRTVSRLLVDIGAPVAYSDAARPIREFRRSDLAECLRVYSAAADALVDWPASFETHLQRIMDLRVAAGAVRPAQVFTEMSHIKRYLKEQAFHAVLDGVLVQFVRSHWGRPLTRRSRWLIGELPDPGSYVALGLVAKAMRKKQTVIAALGERHGVPTLTARESRYRRLRYFHKDHVELLEIAAHEEIPSNHAARALGISKDRMRELLEAGVVPVTHTLRRVWFAARGPLEAMADELWEKAGVAPKCAATDLVPLRWALRHLLKAGQGPGLFEALLRKGLSMWRHEPLTCVGDDLLVSYSEVHAWSTGKLPEEYVSAPDAARTLGINQEALYDLIASGADSVRDQARKEASSACNQCARDH